MRAPPEGQRTGNAHHGHPSDVTQITHRCQHISTPTQPRAIAHGETSAVDHPQGGAYSSPPLMRSNPAAPQPGTGVANETIGQPRIHGLDRVKGFAIVTVLWIHGFQAFNVAKSVYVQRSAIICAWAVPAFFFASGWLHARDTKYPPGTLARWFRRIGIPYVIATIYITIFDARVFGYPISAPRFARDLLLGRGIYYFVPVLMFTMIVTMPLARSRRAAWIVCALLTPYMFMRMRYDPVIWLLGGSWNVLMRSPFRLAPFFMTGWACGLTRPTTIAHWRPVIAWVAPVAWLVLMLVLSAKFATQPAGYWPMWAQAVFGGMILSAIASFVCASVRPASAAVRWLSDATFPLYLYHISFVNLFDRWLRPKTEIQYVERMLLASLVTVILVITVRRILGQRRARELIG